MSMKNLDKNLKKAVKKSIALVSMLIVTGCGSESVTSTDLVVEESVYNTVESSTEEFSSTIVVESKEIEETEVEHRTGEEIVGISQKNILDLSPYEFDSVRNDSTGKWKCIMISDSVDITEYALSCRKYYLMLDDAILAIVNTTNKTTTKISYMFGILDVTVHNYVEGEEHDANIMFTGNVINEYWVYVDNGDVELIQ